MDEQYVGRRLGYLTVCHDPIARRVIGTVAGRQAVTFNTVTQDFVAHQGQPEAVPLIAMDRSKAFQAGARPPFPDAEVCLDAFHVAQWVHDAVDAVRRAEVKQESMLKGTRWGLLKSPPDWSKEQTTDRHGLQRSGLKTARAWRRKQRFKAMHPRCRNGADPEPWYHSWISWARRSRLEPFKRLGSTLKAHLPGLLAAYRLGANHAVAANSNRQIQAAIVRARGRQGATAPDPYYLSDHRQAREPASQPFPNAGPSMKRFPRKTEENP